MRIDIDCKEMARLISDSQDRTLPEADRSRMRLHRVLCETCRNVDEQLGFLRRTMQQLGREQARLPAAPASSRAGPDSHGSS